jgi:hypothetical protein
MDSSSRGQSIRGGSPARRLGVGLTSPHCKNKKLVTKCDIGSRSGIL